MFRFLTLLYENKAYYKDVVEIYKNDIDEQANNTIQVIINKAINALKVFGIKIVKIKNQYHLDSSLYSLKYDLNDLKSICILINASENFPDKKSKDNIIQLLKELELRMDNSSKNILYSMAKNYDFSFFYKDLKKQIDDCKHLCKSEKPFAIKYLKKGKEITTKGFAKDIIFDSKNAYLQMFDTNNNVTANIPLTNILSLKEYHSENVKPENPVTITFEISGRLAKTYELKENESLLEKRTGNLIIINKGEPLDRLFSRLMRYSECCKVLRPTYIQKQMEDLINETIAQYETEE